MKGQLEKSVYGHILLDTNMKFLINKRETDFLSSHSMFSFTTSAVIFSGFSMVYAMHLKGKVQ